MQSTSIVAVAALIAAAAIFATAARAEEVIGDAQALALVQKRCVPCHAAKLAHASFAQPPKNVTLETIADLKRHAKTVLQTLLNRTMPLGNPTGMTDADHANLIAWLRAMN